MYEAYATRWDDAHIIEELIPARGIEFTLPLCDHGEASFSATVEPGRSFWRPALSAAMSGVLICRDGVPQWAGRMTGERQTGARTFEFRFAEWGSAFEAVPAPSCAWTNVNDHDLVRWLITTAQAVSGQNYLIQTPATLGASLSDLTINAWDSTMVDEELRRLSEAAGGPEWYVAATGTLENPTRTLVLGDRLGSVTPSALLEYVENTEPYEAPAAPPWQTPLENIFPVDSRPILPSGLRGGNIIAPPQRSQVPGATVALAIGAGQEAAQLRATAVATDLLTAGYPRRTRVARYNDVSDPITLQRHADADLAASRGMTTTWTVSTHEDDPDWTQVARGDVVRLELDTDVYATERPLVVESRVLEMAVGVPDDGPVVVNWTLAVTRDE